MTNKDKKLKIADILLEFYEEYNGNVPNRPMIPSIYADKISDSLKEEFVSEDLGEYINKLSKQFPEVSFAKLSRIAVRVAKWQKAKDQSTIELTEDHAMLAGMEKMKEQMMKKPTDKA